MHIENEQLIGCDVDDTLVLWRAPLEGEETIDIIDPYDGHNVRLVIHKPHVKLVQDRMARGCAIIVWSQAGPKWAKAVTEALGIVPTLTCGKPFAIIDDLPATAWLGERIYIKPESKYGTL